MKPLWIIGIFTGAAGALFLCSCAPIEPYVERLPVRIPLLAPKPGGWWHDDGFSGEPKIVVHIGEQKAYFYKGKHLVGVSDVSTGKPGFSTPPGHYNVVAKDRDHVSTVFGDYIDDWGNVVKFNIDVRKDPRPPGTHFDGARMPYAMFFRGGYAMHEGYVPPHAASHGCIRLPKGMAEHFFDAAPEGTTMVVKE
jgi:lipoprotein-anchoring transpeptidase ErfK/SrfK